MAEKYKEQHRLMLVEVLHELNRVAIPEFDYQTRVLGRNSNYYLEELIPETKRRRFSKDKTVLRGRVAIRLANDSFAVFQPRWLVPLQEELLAIEPLLPGMPQVYTDYVVVWRDEKYSDITHQDGLVPELGMELSEAKRQYWTAKVNEINAGAQTELPQGDDQVGLEP